ncbi:hypothetical protein ACJJJB_00150 (plasmid) [Microbulbifer sp. ANSA001]|uniref:hypothetical protein n=1 Tax=Microbulbifer sp. ANSA001 TaxID=3243358 RepID=UPI004041BAA3
MGSKAEIKRFAVYGGQMALNDGGRRDFKGAFSSRNLAMKLARQRAKDRRGTWVQIEDRLTNTYTEYGITAYGELKERFKDCPLGGESEEGAQVEAAS